MKRCIVAATVSEDSIRELLRYANDFKQSIIDRDHNKVVIPLDKGMSQENMMSDWGMGTKLVNEGFNVSFEQGDFEYVSKATYYSFGGGLNRVPKKSYLRNRVIMTVTW